MTGYPQQQQGLGINNLQLLEKGVNGKPFDLSWETLEKMLHVSLALKPVQENYAKARQQRVMSLANGKDTIDDPAKIRQLNEEEEKILQQTISVRLPKELFDENNLRCKENKMPPSILMQLGPLFKAPDRPDLYDDDANDY